MAINLDLTNTKLRVVDSLRKVQLQINKAA